LSSSTIGTEVLKETQVETKTEWDNPQYLRGIVIKWFERSQDTAHWQNVFDRFIFLWIAFDAWGSNESHAINEKMIDWVKTSKAQSRFKEIRDEIEPHLRRPSEIDIPNHLSGKAIRLHDAHDFHKLMDVIYQIRNNLFHGHKSPDDRADDEVVTLAYKIVSPLLKPYVEGLLTERN